MSIETLSTLGQNYFRGFKWLSSNKDEGLKAIINNVINKVNEILTGTEFDTLTVGDPTGYYLTGHSWMIIDGYNPPTFSKIRVQDQVTGAFYDCAPESGTWTCNEVT